MLPREINHLLGPKMGVSFHFCVHVGATFIPFKYLANIHKQVKMCNKILSNKKICVCLLKNHALQLNTKCNVEQTLHGLEIYMKPMEDREGFC